jgi:hypothetical protein
LRTFVDGPPAVILPAQGVRRALDVGGAGGHRGLHALDVEHAGVGRAGPTGARTDRDLDPQPGALQGGDQLRHLVGGGRYGGRALGVRHVVPFVVAVR